MGAPGFLFPSDRWEGRSLGSAGLRGSRTGLPVRGEGCRRALVLTNTSPRVWGLLPAEEKGTDTRFPAHFGVGLGKSPLGFCPCVVRHKTHIHVDS